MTVGTPGRLRIAGIAGVVVCLLFGFSISGSTASRSRSISDARNHAAQVLRIQAIRSNLTQADAAATNAFLVGGLESPEDRASYTEGIAGASAAIAAASAASSADAQVLAKTNQVLARYTGLIESARANNRQGFPIGAAYLRQASTLLRSQALPPLAQLVAGEQVRIKDAYDNAAQDNDALVPILGLALLVLVLIQIWLSAKTRRTFNVGLATATVIVALVGLAAIAAMTVAQHRADDVRTGSLAATVALATARTDAFDAKSAESLTLINRGNGQAFEANYHAVITDANHELGIVAHQPSMKSTNLPGRLETYELAHRAVRAKDDAGDWDAAVHLATSDDQHGTTRAFAAFDASSSLALNREAVRVSDGLHTARRSLGAIWVLVLLAGIAAAVLAWRGIALRLREYR